MDKKENLKVAVEVKGKNFLNGQVINSFESDTKITKADAGRVIVSEEDTINFRGGDQTTPKIQVDYHSKSVGQGESQTTIEVDVKGKVFDMNKKELIDAISAGAKLTKADAGRALDNAIEDWFSLKADKDCNSNAANAEGYYTTKVAKV